MPKISQHLPAGLPPSENSSPVSISNCPVCDGAVPQLELSQLELSPHLSETGSVGPQAPLNQQRFLWGPKNRVARNAG